MIWCETVSSVVMMSVMMITLTIFTTMIRRRLLVICIIILNLMIMSCTMICMDRMTAECIVWPAVRQVGAWHCSTPDRFR